MPRIPPPLKIRCPDPECRYEWLRPRAGVVRGDEIVRAYVCPQCGELELVVRKTDTMSTLPVFELKDRKRLVTTGKHVPSAWLNPDCDRFIELPKGREPPVGTRDCQGTGHYMCKCCVYLEIEDAVSENE